MLHSTGRTFGEQAVCDLGEELDSGLGAAARAAADARRAVVVVGWGTRAVGAHAGLADLGHFWPQRSELWAKRAISRDTETARTHAHTHAHAAC
jgi:hypothetical protein